MNAERLLALYERVAEAPDAITRLRRFILDLAVRGKLVPQDPQDEPASELLKRIAKEKARLVKAGEIRKEKMLPEINLEDAPFHLPLNWSWARLGSATRVIQGFAFSSSDFSSDPKDGLPLIKIGDIGGDTPETFIKGSPDLAYLVRPGDILLGLSGSIKCSAWNGPKALLNQRIARIAPVSEELDTTWLLFSVHACIDKWKEETSKLTVQNVRAAQLYEAIFPLPPLAEQHRIVAKVDELMALCGQLEAARQERESRRDRLAAASLARLNTPDPETFQSDARFALNVLPPLTTRPNQIKQLRQTILNLAVRGKLVPQDPNEEPASELLKQLKKARAALEAEGKIRKDKGEPPSHYGGEQGFDLPHSWLWARLTEIGQTQTGTSPSSANADLFGNFIPFVKPADLDGNQINYDGPGLSEIGISHSRIAAENSILMVCIGATLGKVNTTSRPVCFNQQINSLTPFLDGLTAFIAIALKASDFQSLAWSKAGTGTLPIISKGKWEVLPIPLPPIAEQHRIVAKVEKLMELCDGLEASLTTSDQTRTRLLEATLAEALAPANVTEMEPAE
ncbi:MAG: restriction endonuclease subunit S [Roseomonas sp.]|nr:restriction endonuclease subunit S [Roseomonas sp.]MCA3292417.1 restriction endonuclease subunit S [Roseomonas sp.]MCA3293649.1 restriction endonuclease subunit S [Roseomonas sp.]